MYLYLWYFLIFSFLGWCVEVGFHALKSGKFVNRGFNSGPVCPIYGAGLVFVGFLFRDILDTWLWLFLASVLVCTLVELVVGFLMDKIFKNKWWDYSREKFNLHGYICPKFSLIWGVLCMFACKTLTPLESLINWVNHTLGIVLLCVFYAIFLVDFITSTISVVKMNKRLAKLSEVAEEISKKLTVGSDFIGEGVYRGTVVLQKEYDKLLAKTAKLSARIVNAFPDMTSLRYNEQLKKLREKLQKIKEERKKKTKK